MTCPLSSENSLGRSNHYSTLLFQATKPAAVRQIGYLLLFGGIIVIIVAFLGCCGAAKEWRPLLCCVSLYRDDACRKEDAHRMNTVEFSVPFSMPHVSWSFWQRRLLLQSTQECTPAWLVYFSEYDGELLSESNQNRLFIAKECWKRTLLSRCLL